MNADIDSLARTPDDFDVQVGQRIRARRLWLSMSQTTLAASLGVSFQQVQKYERGANRVSAAVLVRIAERLEVEPSDLLGQTPQSASFEAMAADLAAPGAAELLAAFSAIQGTAMKRAIVDLVRSLAGLDEAPVRATA